MAPLGSFNLAIIGVVVSLVLSGCGAPADANATTCTSAIKGELAKASFADIIKEKCDKATAQKKDAFVTCKGKAEAKVETVASELLKNYTGMCADALSGDDALKSVNGSEVDPKEVKAAAEKFFKDGKYMAKYKGTVEAEVKEAIDDLTEKSKGEKGDGKKEEQKEDGKKEEQEEDGKKEEQKEDGNATRLYDSGIQSVSLVGINSVVFACVIAGMLAGTVGLIAVLRRSSHQPLGTLIDSEESDSANA